MSLTIFVLVIVLTWMAKKEKNVEHDE